MKRKGVSLRLVDITTEEFASLKQYFPQSGKNEVKVNFTFDVRVHSKRRLVGMFTKFQFLSDEKVFLISEVGCHFLIKKEDWLQMEKPDGIILPKDLLTHLLVLTVGTSRGVIHAKKPKDLQGIMLPTFDVTQHFKKDLVIINTAADEEE